MEREAGILGRVTCPLGLGLLRLSIEDRPNFEEAIRLIHEALDAGVRVLDTADSYGLDHKDLHYGERLAAEAVKSWSGPGEEVKILTKVGLARPKGRWVPAGSPQDLRRAVDGSLKALATERLFLVQLHVKDSRVPFEETLAALAELQRSGKVEHLGLCNVGPAELRQAQRHFNVATVQNELSVLARASTTQGMLEMARQLKIPFLAHRPLGGYAKSEKLAKNRTLVPLAERHGVTPHEIALAALLRAGEHVIPLVGARRSASLRSSLRALALPLDASDLETLEKKFSFAPSDEALRAIAPQPKPHDLPSLAPNQGPSELPEVVVLMGIQGAGKSGLVEAYTAAGYLRLNRDLAGGTLEDIAAELRRQLASGHKRIVLDNTYPTRISREAIIRAAHAEGLPVRCRYLATPAHEAHFNVAQRMFQRYGRLLGPDEMKSAMKSDPNLPPPIALQNWLQSFEPPALDEGFSAVDQIAFERRLDQDYTQRGLLLDVDGTIRTTKSGERYPRQPHDIELRPGCREVLERWLDAGYKLFFVSNQSGVSSGKLSQADAEACFARTIELLDLPVTEVAYCPHPAFPVGCFCRKPLPGLAVQLMHRHQLSPREWVVVGDLDSDRAFAAGIGAKYYDAGEFFAGTHAPPAVA